jgi:hypothetical protein
VSKEENVTVNLSRKFGLYISAARPGFEESEFFLAKVLFLVTGGFY